MGSWKCSIEYVEIYGTLLAYHQQIIPIFSKLVITLMTIPLALVKEKYYQFLTQCMSLVHT